MQPPFAVIRGRGLHPFRRVPPHPRRARILDEGGRGLLLVARLTRRWGTRHTPIGKTIWAEQSLRPEAG